MAISLKSLETNSKIEIINERNVNFTTAHSLDVFHNSSKNNFFAGATRLERDRNLNLDIILGA